VGTSDYLDTAAKRKHLCPCRESNLVRPARSLVTILTELSLLKHLISTYSKCTSILIEYSIWQRMNPEKVCNLHSRILFFKSCLKRTSKRHMDYFKRRTLLL
jgi:hypothetical protein